VITPIDAQRGGPAAPRSAPPLWCGLLPAGRRFVALPSSRDPVIVAELDAEVLSYVRTSLLTAPPRSRLPAWAYTAADQALRLPWTWRLLPQWRPDATTSTGALNGVLTAHGRRLVVLQHSRDHDGRCVALLFDPGSGVPSHAVKIAPSAVGGPLRREARALADVARLRSTALECTVPRAVDLVESDGTSALVTTARPGVPMLVTYHRPGHTSDPRSVRRDLSVVARWLTCVQAATTGPPEPLDVPDDTVHSLRRLGDGRPDGERLLEVVAALRRRLRRLRAPTTLVQGDFWPGNVLVDRDQVTGVVDWEHYRPAGSPLRDVARFALGYASYLDHGPSRYDGSGANATAPRGWRPSDTASTAPAGSPICCGGSSARRCTGSTCPPPLVVTPCSRRSPPSRPKRRTSVSPTRTCDFC